MGVANSVRRLFPVCGNPRRTLAGELELADADTLGLAVASRSRERGDRSCVQKSLLRPRFAALLSIRCAD